MVENKLPKNIWDKIGAIAFFLVYTIWLYGFYNPDSPLWTLLLTGVLAYFLFVEKLWARILVTLVVSWNIVVAFIDIVNLGVLNSRIIKIVVFLLLLAPLVMGYIKARQLKK
jgi:cellulose synthase/poly-beta-1,6-N-acetylglucosamine synthase-like glycosyltransferase